MTGTNVARLPRKYAMLHFSTPRPVLDLANVQPCLERAWHRDSALRKVLWPLVAFRFEDLRTIKGDCSVGELSLPAPSTMGESLKVTVLLTRCPVLGRIRVA